ncbi:hypothetical protein ASC89_04450 [Devosia sp. Root413D1]|uniref:response regulator n=1 Tax=Devosia sp. Root413D1 TaxID=1736531 RepID=UPI000700BEFC|nr:response regulator [Devosia sp. Root413D1]KQW81087.1 hypothetical protein ASC89_04450 [Devosia sp. Root413D1]
MNILVVDDEPLIRLGLVSLLEEWGHQAVSAGNAAAAIAALEADQTIELVVTDINMPGTMDGIGLAKYVAGRWPPVRLIVMSGKVAPADNELPAGARFFSKPFRDQVMQAAIEEMRST